MKTQLSILGLSALLALTSGCAGSSSNNDNDTAGGGTSYKQSVDSNGYCTMEFISDYNNVMLEIRQVQIAAKMQSESMAESALTSLKNACARFNKNHAPSVSCLAEVDYKETTIGSANVTKPCEIASQQY